jgi:DNA polymerase-3 subunit delta'
MRPLGWHAHAFAALLLEKSRLPHALLLKGPRGIGKLVFARALAQALLCESPADDGAACGRCTACAWFEAGTHPDFRQIEPANLAEDDPDDDAEQPEKPQKAEKKKSVTIAVSQIRALPEFLNLSTHRGGVRVVVLHPAEAMNVNAANALLKSLEEPPPRTQFILVTHRPQQLLPTIKSRCRQLALAAPRPEEAARWLSSQGLRDPALALAQSGGAPLLAAEMNEPEYWGARAAFMRHLAAAELDVLSAAEAARDVPIAYGVAWLQKWSYDVASHRMAGSIRYNPDYAVAIEKAAARADPLAMLRFHREMVQTQAIVNHPLNARLFLEQLLLAYQDAARSARLAA